MPLGSTAGEDATARGRRVTATLMDLGEALGFSTAAEYPVEGGRIDVVWLLDLPAPLAEAPVPVVGFEIESSWRTRKHLKGDYLNLLDLGASVGVLVLLGDGADVEATRRFAEKMVDRPGARVTVWAEAEVERLAARTAPDGGR